MTDKGIYYETVILDKEVSQKETKGDYLPTKLGPLMNFRMYGVIF